MEVPVSKQGDDMPANSWAAQHNRPIVPNERSTVGPCDTRHASCGKSVEGLVALKYLTRSSDIPLLENARKQRETS
jgi:hypothetical protein